MKQLREFIIRVEHADGFLERFIVESVIGSSLTSFRVGKQVTLESILRVVQAGNIVTLFPGTNPKDEDIIPFSF